MSPLPLPVRLAAGLAALAVEQARKLPKDVSEWPMSAVSQALQMSMRVQQRITELAIKGDEALAGLREPAEDPPWAVFDEDLPQPTMLRPNVEPDPSQGTELGAYDLGSAEDTTAEEQSWFEAIDQLYGNAAAEPLPDTTGTTDTSATSATAQPAGTGVAAMIADDARAAERGATAPPANEVEEGPTALPTYRELSLASVRGRLRTFTIAELEELLAYERSHQDRPDFVRMLTNRIATVRDL